MTPAERAAAPESIAPEDVADAVVSFARDETPAGRVMVLRGGEPRRLVDPVER
jgi:uncharacterized protein YbjT (DUF2867 family)